MYLDVHAYVISLLMLKQPQEEIPMFIFWN